MNIELMEKIAKRKEDPNYPYGNKLGAGHTVKSTLSDAAGGALVGGALMSPVSMWLGSKAGKAVGGLTSKGKDIGESIGALAGGTLPIVWGAIDTARSGKKKRLNDKALSFLPSNEQIALKKKESNINKKRDTLYKAQDALYNKDMSDQKEIDNANELWTRYQGKIDDLDDKWIRLFNDATARGKALMLAEKKNRRLFKKASLDYDEMVKFAYEDILGGFEKSAAENDDYILFEKTYDAKDNGDNETARKERKEKMLKRLAAAGALTAGATAAGVGLYKYQHRPGRYYSETSAFRKNMRDAMRGKPVEDWNDKVEIVTPGNSHHTILTPLLSAAH